MGKISVADAKAHLSDLLARAESGESVEITRRGKPVARIVPAQAPRKRIDLAALRNVVAAMPAQPEPAAELVRRMREAARY